MERRPSLSYDKFKQIQNWKEQASKTSQIIDFNKPIDQIDLTPLIEDYLCTKSELLKQLEAKNEQRLNYMGSILYKFPKTNNQVHSKNAKTLLALNTSSFSASVIDNKLFDILSVRIDAAALYVTLIQKENIWVNNNAVWGTDIYTDDSDVMAVLLHCGYLKFGSTKLQDPTKNTRSLSVSEKAPLASMFSEAKPSIETINKIKPIELQIQILPKMECYYGTLKNGYRSRSWTHDSFSHDGISYKVHIVKTIEKIYQSKKQRKKDILQFLEHRTRTMRKQ